VRVTGTLSASPITRAGESYAPDAPATVRDASGAERPVNATAADASPAGAGSEQSRVQRHAKALDTTTPVAGTLAISTIEAAPR
jgi:hypothetical protein